ncbi:MAG: ABC transporter permease [Gemmatimonadaceae bacterium]|nr:ABC transporter permease [Gemmatimonadaceae bacterium]
MSSLASAPARDDLRVRTGIPLRWLIAGATALATVAVVIGILIIGGYDTSAALAALWNGAFGSPYAVLSATLVRATPLLFVGLAVGLAFRAGVLNIGAEGQLLAGAAAAVAVGLAIGTWPRGVALPLVLLAGMTAGAAWAGIAAWLKLRFGVLEVISTLMLNFVATYGVSWLVRGPLQEPTRIYPQTVELSNAVRLPALITGHRVHLGFLIALALAVLAWWALTQTAAGFRVRAVGASVRAAQSAGGVNTLRTTALVFLVSGALAGLGGASEATGVTFALYEGLSPGYGYSAIAVALLARLHPLAIIASALLFGALEAGAAAMQRDANVPSVLAAVVEALIVLGVLAFERARTQGRES